MFWYIGLEGYKVWKKPMKKDEKQSVDLEKPTVNLINKLMRMRKERKTDDPIDFNLLLRHLIQKEIQYIKDEFPTDQDLKERNRQRFNDLRENKGSVYCPMYHKRIGNLAMCHVGCMMGHMTECHYPYDCNSDYCEHYANDDLEKVSH
jgi:hypothetical protein